MSNSKTYTWKEFEAGLSRLPAHVQQQAMPAVRNAIYRESKILEVIAETMAAVPVPGTKPSNGKTRSRNRNYGYRLNRTISRFKNTKEPLRAYTVVGGLTRNRGGALYHSMQLGGYRPGRPSNANKASAIAKYGRTKQGNANTDARAYLAGLRTKIAGKNFYAKAYAMYGAQVEGAAMRSAIAEIDKVLAKV